MSGRLVPLLGLLFVSSGCALGFGRLGNVSSPVGASQATESRVVGTTVDGTHLLVQDYAGASLDEGFHLPVGLSGGVMPTFTVTMPGSSPSFAGEGGVGLGWVAHGDLFVPLTGWSDDADDSVGLGVTLQYQFRYQTLDYLGGFGLGSRQHGVMGYFGIDLGPVGVELGAGGLFGGLVGVGGRGDVLSDGAFTYASAPASGLRTAVRGTLFISGGGFLQMKTGVRLEAGYQHLWAAAPPPGVPPRVGSFSLGAELVFSFF